MSNIGFNIYELTQRDMRNDTPAHSLLHAGLAYDFGDDKDGASYLAIPSDDESSNDFFIGHHPNSFLFSMGAISAGVANNLFHKLMNKEIEMDDIPPAPPRRTQSQIPTPDVNEHHVTPKAKPKTKAANPPALPLANTTTVPSPRRPHFDLRSTDVRLRFFLDKRLRARIAAATKTPRS